MVATAIGAGVGYRLGVHANAAAVVSTIVAGNEALQPPAQTPSKPGGMNHATSAAAVASPFPPDPVGALDTGEASFEQLLERARTDAHARAAIWARYKSEPDPLKRQTLLALLAQAPAAARSDYVAMLMEDADPERRRDGYRLLTGLPIEDALARDHAVRALQREPDPRALAELAQGLQPGLLAAEDAEPLARALESLAQAGDPGVRAATLPVLAQWSERAQLEPIYLAALGDRDAAVRGGAIAGINTANVSTPSLRGALFQLAANPAESAEHRHNALLALARFRLTRAEVELYRMLQAEVPVDAGNG